LQSRAAGVQFSSQKQLQRNLQRLGKSSQLPIRDRSALRFDIGNHIACDVDAQLAKHAGQFGLRPAPLGAKPPDFLASDIFGL